MNTARRVLYTTLIGFVAAGCGGGGGGGGSPGLTPADATVAITASNAVTVIRSVDDSSGFVEALVFGTLAGSAGVTTASVVATAAADSAADTDTVTLQALSTEFCSGGSADVTEAGPRVTFVFVNCQDFVYSSANLGLLEIPGLVNGQLVIEVSLASQSDQDFSATATFNDFSIDDSWADGELELDYLETGVLVMVEVLTSTFDIREGDETLSLQDYRYVFMDDSNRTLEETEESSGGVASSEFNGLAVFSTPQPFATDSGDLWPSAGRRVISGASGARIRLTALNNAQARVELNLDADPDYEISCSYPWGDLLGDTPLVCQ